jgi:hypothetical protein
MTAELPSSSSTEHRRLQLIMALGLFDLTDRDRQLIDWLSTWDQSTVDALADLLARLIRPGVSR